MIAAARCSTCAALDAELERHAQLVARIGPVPEGGRDAFRAERRASRTRLRAASDADEIAHQPSMRGQVTRDRRRDVAAGLIEEPDAGGPGDARGDETMALAANGREWRPDPYMTPEERRAELLAAEEARRAWAGPAERAGMTTPEEAERVEAARVAKEAASAAVQAKAKEIFGLRRKLEEGETIGLRLLPGGITSRKKLNSAGRAALRAQIDAERDALIGLERAAMDAQKAYVRATIETGSAATRRRQAIEVEDNIRGAIARKRALGQVVDEAKLRREWFGGVGPGFRVWWDPDGYQHVDERADDE